ncbi:hypothetical protein CEXT_799381 [Caerostris extrusa]|uniref:Uncharacterized protein n=1 Tax=Caerostris extrusa TaxID=172846 RepID=A0AAV4XYS6_CAEEX|nr:hypothetical protein CEXT_799381 [Caerostris extrusa]
MEPYIVVRMGRFINCGEHCNSWHMSRSLLQRLESGVGDAGQRHLESVRKSTEFIWERTNCSQNNMSQIT